MVCPVHIGIAGWSYADWNGIVYPHVKMDQLSYVSRYVDCIEINSTFYRPPSEKMAASWAERTTDKKGFFFTAKLNQEFTHKGHIDTEMVKQFHEGFGPLLEAKKLNGLLAQFRYDFDDTIANRHLVAEIVKRFGDTFEMVVEVRHKSWQQIDALKFMEELGVAVCNLDYPVSSNSFDLRACTVGTNGYFRMHGRNYETWYSKTGRDETYDYYYSHDELGQIKSRIDELSHAFRSLTVIANNHYRGAELANALELKFLLTGKKPPAPESLIEVYPNLAGIAANV
ncbi:MAG: DUF72 domain-containing protein [Phycisphaerae bacterium]|nr:DUF72 domain-containing protein [Phycisphaerae bacterium]